MGTVRKAIEHAKWVGRTASLLLRRSPDRWRTACLMARLYWRERRGKRQDRLHLLRLADGEDVLELWVGDFSDLHVARETFGDEVYGLPVGFRPRTIVDLGANIGASVLWFHRRFPDAQIHAVEPDRRSLEKLRRNIATLPGVTIHHAAVAGESGERTFYEARRGWESSLLAATARGGQASTVSALTLPGLIQRCVGGERVDLLKLDVEGAEWEILPKVRLAAHADVVAGELHCGVLGDEQAEHAALRHGLADLTVRYDGHSESGHFVAWTGVGG